MTLPMNIAIKASGMEMTDAINQYAEDKIVSLDEYFEGIVSADVTVGSRGNHHNKGKIFFAAANLHVPGHDLRVEKDAENLYKAIDKVRDHFKIELEKIKGKMNQIDREGIRDQKAYTE